MNGRKSSWRASWNEKRESDGLAPIDYDELYNISLTEKKRKCTDTTDDIQASRPPKRKRAPSDSFAVVNTWFDANIDNPYPTEDQKEELVQQSGLKKKQIEDWLYSQRKKKGLTKSKKTANNALPSAATSVLDTWFNANIDNPYPTRDQKQELVQQSGLKKTQIEDWFVGQRKKNGLTKSKKSLKKPKKDTSLPENYTTGQKPKPKKKRKSKWGEHIFKTLETTDKVVNDTVQSDTPSNIIHLDSSDDTHMDKCFICGDGGGKSLVSSVLCVFSWVYVSHSLIVP